jgi:hypothetical protein
MISIARVGDPRHLPAHLLPTATRLLPIATPPVAYSRPSVAYSRPSVAYSRPSVAYSHPACQPLLIAGGRNSEQHWAECARPANRGEQMFALHPNL